MNLEFNIIWVEAGRSVPTYAINNFNLTNKLHPKISKYLVTDSKDTFKDLKVLEISDAKKSQETKKFEAIDKIWPHKQEYFWHGTTARFFHLYDAMINFNLRNVVHLETDSILLHTEAIHSILVDLKVRMAYPLQAKRVGCASILFIRSAEDLKSFIDFIIMNWHRKDVDDMVLLGEFSDKSGVKVLATSMESSEPRQDFIFDAGSIGHYFMGTDARNCRLPFSKRGIADHREGSLGRLLEQGDLKFASSLETKRIQISIKGSSTRLANIHLHSKNISPRIFLMNVVFKIGFGKRIPFLWRLGFFDEKVFMERLASFWARRVKRVENFRERVLR